MHSASSSPPARFTPSPCSPEPEDSILPAPAAFRGSPVSVGEAVSSPVDRSYYGVLCDDYRDAIEILGWALKLNVRVKDSGLQDRLAHAAGGFMDADEMAQVREQLCDSTKMTVILDSLVTAKDDEAFCLFVSLLEECGASCWAQALRETAAEKGTLVPEPPACTPVAQAGTELDGASRKSGSPASGVEGPDSRLQAVRTELASALKELAVLRQEVQERGLLIQSLFRTIRRQGNLLEDVVNKRVKENEELAQVVEAMGKVLRP